MNFGGIMNLFKKTIEFDVIVGSKAVIKGDIETEGSVCIDGKVIGNIKTKGLAIISLDAALEGNLEAESADVYGKVVGNIETTGPVTINEEASVKGDVECEAIKTSPGSEFLGKLTVNKPKNIPAPANDKIAAKDVQKNKAPTK
ncbi:bactofilin family protein [Bacteroides heparinolyticus]|uniref:bactofilin family protein n=1 Tax=Prevotella heparinolytica TaxID=28113 RepID=UPI0035A03758